MDQAWRNRHEIWIIHLEWFFTTKRWIIENIHWFIGSSRETMIGINPIYGVSSEYMLPFQIMNHLQGRRIFRISQILKGWDPLQQFSIWMDATDMGINDAFFDIWNRYVF